MDLKPFWASRTLWVQLVAFVFALLAASGHLPKDLDQEQVVATIMAIVAIVSFVLRFFTYRPIAAPTVPPTGGSGAALALALLLAPLALSTTACGPVASAGSIATRADTELTRIEQLYADTRGFVALFVEFLPEAQRARVEAAQAKVEAALALARTAVDAGKRATALAAAAEALAELKHVAGA